MNGNRDLSRIAVRPHVDLQGERTALLQKVAAGELASATPEALEAVRRRIARIGRLARHNVVAAEHVLRPAPRGE